MRASCLRIAVFATWLGPAIGCVGGIGDHADPAMDDPSPQAGRGAVSNAAVDASRGSSDARPSPPPEPPRDAATGRSPETSSAPPPDAAPAQPRLDAAQVAFHDDFDDGKLDARVWTVDRDGSNTVEVQSARTHRGNGALHVHMAPNTTFGVIKTLAVPASLHEHQFGRLFYFLTPRDPEGHAPVLSSGSANGYPYADWHYEIGMGAGAFNLSWWSGANGAGEAGASAQPIPTGAWTCLEWEFDDRPSTLRMWVDGKQVATYRADVPSRVGLMRQFIVGLREWHPSPYAIDLYVDDVALDTSRIGCP